MGEPEPWTDLPRDFVIRESGSQILNPFDEVKLATLAAALRLPPGFTVLDLACGKGELLCTWSRDHGVRGTGVDLSSRLPFNVRPVLYCPAGE